jgi:hypothetical protein
MNRDKNELDLRVLCVRLKECLELLQNDALRINCARKARSIQKWEAVVNCGIACEKVIQAMESNDLNRVGANIPECRLACRKCISYCYASKLFQGAYIAASRILSQLVELD